ncbi:acyl transferase/acyl hydrolase/lysophospholipase [Lipomyces tetrasporus]
MTNQANPPPCPRSLRLLSLDGGGVRGLSELLILKRLMHRIQPQTKSQKLAKPCDFFDVICGTSTGGLIALMLGRLEMDIDECIQAYIKLSKEIFPKEEPVKWWWWWWRWWSTVAKYFNAYRGKSWFSAEALERCLKETIKEKLGESEVDQEFLTESNSSKVSVCVTRVANRSQTMIRGYPSKMEPPVKCTIWEAARATSAAPLYFDPISIGSLGSIYADGGMGNNNPVWALYNEVRREWSEAQIACLVSIGTGKLETMGLGSGLQEVLRACVDIATETEKTAQQFLAHSDMAKQGRYFRFNVEQGMQGVGLEECKHMDKMDAATQGYLNNHNDELGLCAAKLMNSNKILKDLPQSAEISGYTTAGESGFSEAAPALAKFGPDLVAVWHGRTELLIFENTRLYWSRFSREGDGTPRRGEINLVHENAHSRERPAVAALAGKLVASWKGVNNETLYFSTLHPGSLDWSNPVQIPGAGSSTGPALALWEMNGLTRVYALWKGIDGDKYAYLAWYDGERWDAPIRLPFVETDANVSLTCPGGEIFVSWKDSRTERIKWMRLDKDGNELLEEPQELGRNVESNLGPALAEVSGTIYAAWKGKGPGPSADVWLTSWPGEGNRFRPAQLVPNSNTDRAPSLSGWDNLLVLAWKGVDSEKSMWWRYG